jgi:hypothetical protein
VRITFPAFPRQHRGQIKKRLVVAAEPADQSRFEGSIFSGSERKFVRSNRNKKRIEVLIGIGTGIKSGRTDREGSFMRVVMQRAPRRAALYPGLRMEGDQMLPQIGAEMRAALVSQAHNRDATFARRAAACQYRRRRTVFLGRKNFANICNHGR